MDIPPVHSPEQQRQIAEALVGLIRFLLRNGSRVCFICNQINDEQAIEALHPILVQRGVSSLLVLEKDKYEHLKKDGHPLTKHDYTYVPHLWNTAEELCHYMFKKVKIEDMPTYSLFVNYLELKGQGCPGTIREVFDQIYGSSESSWWINNFKIKPDDLQAIGNYGRLMNIVEDKLDRVVMVGDVERRDVARRQLCIILQWMVHKIENKEDFQIEDLYTEPEHISNDYEIIHRQIVDNLVSVLQVHGLVDTQDKNIKDTGVLSPRSDELPSDEFCHRCYGLLRPSNKFCTYCGAELDIIS